MYDTHGTGRSSVGSRGCSPRRSRATLGPHPAPRSSVHRCSCSADPCPKSAFVPVHLKSTNKIQHKNIGNTGW